MQRLPPKTGLYIGLKHHSYHMGQTLPVKTQFPAAECIAAESAARVTALIQSRIPACYGGCTDTKTG